VSVHVRDEGLWPMGERDWLAEQFEENRGHLRGVAYRMLGSLSEADDAVQEAWLRLSRTDTSDVENLGGWLTTVVGRVCLDMLRARKTRREESLDARVTGPIVNRAGGSDPEQEALLADSVGLALLVVLETLEPAERLAFVLHDMFAVPFDEIAPILGRSTQAAKMLASRARRRARTAQVPEDSRRRRRTVVEAFLAASRNGDFAALLDLLDPDVTARADPVAAAGATLAVRGAHVVARRALAFSHRARHAHLGIVDGEPAILVMSHGRPVTLLTFTIPDSRIVAIDIIADPARLERIRIESPAARLCSRSCPW
jgi:RNA polymerase sigma factor (sigma-70 family)